MEQQQTSRTIVTTGIFQRIEEKWLASSAALTEHLLLYKIQISSKKHDSWNWRGFALDNTKWKRKKVC